MVKTSTRAIILSAVLTLFTLGSLLLVFRDGSRRSVSLEAPVAVDSRLLRDRAIDSGPTGILPVLQNLSDLDSDGMSELFTFSAADGRAVWRAKSLLGIDSSASGTAGLPGPIAHWQFGDPAGVPVPGDYNGDGKLDLASFTPHFLPQPGNSRGNWRIYYPDEPLLLSHRDQSRTIEGDYQSVYWGNGDDRAVPGDYDGDSKTDIAVFTPASATWKILFAAGEFNRAKALLGMDGFGRSVQWGLAGDIPVPADYNGDGCTDLAVVREEEATLVWHIRYVVCHDAAYSEERISFGKPGDTVMAGRYGEEKRALPTVHRASEGVWLSRVLRGKYIRKKWKNPHGLPVTGDFDGDGKDDVALFDPLGSTRWVLVHSRFGEAMKKAFYPGDPVVSTLVWGQADALPVTVLLRRHQAGRRG